MLTVSVLTAAGVGLAIAVAAASGLVAARLLVRASREARVQRLEPVVAARLRGRPAVVGARPSSRLGGWAERLTGLPLRWQIGTLVLVGLAAILLLFGELGAAIAQDGKDRTLSEWLSVTTSTANFLDSEIESQYARLERVATFASAAAGDPAEQRRVVEIGLGQRESFAASAFLLNVDASLAWSDSFDTTALAGYVSAQPRLAGLVRAGDRFASGVENLGGNAVFIVAVPVSGPDGRPLGVLGLIGRPDEGVMQDLVASAHGLAHSGHAELVDQNDQVIASSELGRALGPGEHPDYYGPLLARRRSAVALTGPVGAMAMNMDPADQGRRHDMAFVPLRSVPWGLAVGGDDAELSADANRWQQQLLLFGGLSLALAMFGVWLTTRRVAQPIEALIAASRQIAAGNLATPVPHRGEGEVRELAVAFDDMRQQLQGAHAALALEESRYEGIVGSMADAVVTTDLHLRITAFNSAAAALTGWSHDDAIGRLCCEVICQSAASPEQCELACTLVGPEPAPGISKQVIRARDGAELNVAVTRSPIRDETGDLAGIVHVLRDISAEEELGRLKDEFLSTVSHELRTPLGFIMGYATTLLLPDAPDDPAARRRCIEVIAEASGELKELVDNLLDMTKIGARSLSVSPVPTRLRPLVDAAVERVELRDRDHRFVAVLPRSLPSVLADPRRVEQVLYNLLDNAMKYSPDGGAILIQAEAGSGREVVVSVLDEGLGISPEEMPLLFGRFFRGRTARQRGIGGTGLGLAICKGLIEAQGGRIWAESPAGSRRSRGSGGTAIHFTLPVVAERMELTAVGPRVASAAPTSR